MWCSSSCAIRAARVVAKLEVNDNGIQPGITIVANRKIAPGAQLTLFNPFHTLAAQWPLASLDYTFRFGDEKDGEVVQNVHVTPKAYATRTRLRLPLDGRLLVWDGHDFYSHHRRFDFDHPVAVQIGFKTNAARYSYDFTWSMPKATVTAATARSTRITSRTAGRCSRRATARSSPVANGVAEDGSRIQHRGGAARTAW